jgi:PAS domain-containing protein
MLHSVRSKIMLLGIAALVLSLGVALPLELLAGRQDSRLVAREELTGDVAELATALDVLQNGPEAERLIAALFRRLGQTEELYILDSQGAVVASTEAGRQGRPLSDSFRPLPEDLGALLSLTGPPVVRDLPSRAGPVTEVFAPLSGGRTLLAVLPPKTFATLRQLLLYHAIPPLLAAVLLLGTIIWVGLNRLVMRPLRLLAESSRKVASGEEEAAGIIPPELIPDDDVGEVLRLRNRMLERLESARHRLQDQLEQRTFELEVAHHVSGQLGHFNTDEQLLQEVLVQLSRVVPWEVAAGFLVEAGRARVWARSRNPVSAAAAAQLGGWLDELCRNEKWEHTTVLQGLWASVGWEVTDPAGPTVERLSSRLAFPLRVDAGFAGAVVLGSNQANAYAGHHQRIIRDVLERGLSAVGRVRHLVAAQARELETVLQGMSLGIVILDGSGAITYINRKGVECLARLGEPGHPSGGGLGTSRILDRLVSLEDPAAPGTASRINLEGSLQITLTPFGRSSGKQGGGHFVMIEETAREE